MTLLTIAQAAADKIGLRRPSAVITSTDAEVEKLLRNINEEVTDLIAAAYWQQLRTEQTFTAIAGGTQTGFIPADWNRMVPETFWDRSGQRLMTAVASAVEWQNLKAINYTGPEPKFVIRGNVLYVLPVMAGGETLACEYISNNFARAASGGAAQSSYLVDGDTTVLDEPLITLGAIWRYKADEGLPFAADKVKYDLRLALLLDNNAPTSGTMLSADIFGGGRVYSGAPTSGASSLLT